MLLSVDWDAFSGTRELVFDAPIWGTADREADRLSVWQERAHKRGGAAGLAQDFPLYSGWERLREYAGVPTFLTLSHADAWDWVGRFGPQPVLNVDSHHDLASFSGDAARVRPGNWAGLALAQGRIERYTCLYPDWHADLPVAEGYDLERTRAEVTPLLSPEVARKVKLTRQAHPADGWPAPSQVTALLLVQSPAWCSPLHDETLLNLAAELGAVTLTPPLERINLLERI